MKKEQYRKEYILYLVALLITGWFLWSWWDVLANNMTPNMPSKANAFRILTAICDYIHE